MINGVSETVENELKEQWCWFWGIVGATLGASLLGNMLASKGEIKVGEETIRVREDFECHLIL